MAGKVKRGKPGGRRKARTATRGLKVSAVKATAGRAVTSVNVEVEPDELKSEIGEFGDVRSVSARFPEDDRGRPGHVLWKREQLQPAGTEERGAEGKRRTVKRFFNVHYGPGRSDELGVGVEVETDQCRVKAPAAGHAYTVKDDSKPGESEVAPTGRGRKKAPP
jgi:hypothetical protein